jgi:hypothetical protein
LPFIHQCSAHASCPQRLCNNYQGLLCWIHREIAQTPKILLYYQLQLHCITATAVEMATPVPEIIDTSMSYV